MPKMRLHLVAVLSFMSVDAFLNFPFGGLRKSAMNLMNSAVEQEAEALSLLSGTNPPKLNALPSDEESPSSLESFRTTTLAGPFLVRCLDDGVTCSFRCFAIDDLQAIDPAYHQSVGARSWAALHYNVTESQTKLLQGQVPALEMTATMKENHVEVVYAHCDEHQELQLALSRVIVQWLVHRRQPHRSHPITISFPRSPDALLLKMSNASNDHVNALFADLVPSESAEIVEMVDRDGHALGRIPRALVHRHNLLHRGIGMFVTAQSPIQIGKAGSSTEQVARHQPDLYVHRRTATKKIFPSLYDMFVGGVSLAGENAETTALREVSEELGLAGNPQQLSPQLLSCVVCTAYNRCFVVLFSYTMDLSKETVSWQDEEVAWGSFVPYPIVEAAADRSILRLVATRSWPGRLPAIQSGQKSQAPLESGLEDWELWDFVPDGLLVWEAWLRWLAA